MTDEPATEAVRRVDGDSRPTLAGPFEEGAPSVWDRTDWWAVGALFLVSLILVGLHVRAYTQLSPIDELQHIDYVIKAGDFEPPHVNDPVGFEAMAEAACRSVDAPGYIGPPCGLDRYDPEDFQENGVNTAARQFPVYYTITGVISRFVVATGAIGSQVTAARLVGGLWAGAAWSMMWYVLALLRIGRARRVVALAALIATPFTLFHAATVNADGLLMFTGSLSLVATLKFEARRLNGWLLLVFFAALYFLEATNILAIATCAAYLAVRVSRSADAPALRRILPAVAIAMVLVFRLRVAAAVQRFLFPASPRTLSATMFTDNAAPDGVVWDRVLAQLDTLFTPVNYAYVPSFLQSQRTYALQEVVNWLLIGAMFAVAIGVTSVRSAWAPGRHDVQGGPVADDRNADLADDRSGDPAGDVTVPVGGSSADDDVADGIADEQSRWLTRFGMVALIAAGPFYTFSFAYFSDADFPSQARFALPLVTLLVVGLASALTTRWAMGIASVVVTLSSANLLWLLLTP